ncbi:trichohyalin-like isoform X1 [Biomphalaria glabrata]|uniref:Trichohyalin-like isoform X1 n=1 Tax=Biomphalaria glabrata TaxID=6526 RepID=A0A9W2YTQ5_BIOGL|nr:trichohyalin-like isoform X1 [Biomphalaria glabrata]
MTEGKSIDSLAIPKRQKVFDKTLLPAGDVLPVWQNVSLDTKLPIPPSPRDCFILYTNKLGEPKYKSYQRYDFDLSNPRGREAPGPYDSLTDPSLKYYFNSPRTKQHLIESGLITDAGEIKCSIKEFNQYREFIRYRAVTELALQKRREKREEEEQFNRMLIEWPKVHKLAKAERLRLTRSEPPPRENVEALEMYKEDLTSKYKRKEKAKLANKLKRKLKKKERQSSQDVENEEEIKEEDGDTQVRSRKVENKASKTNDVGDKTNRSDAGKESTTMSSHRGTVLIHEMRQREEDLRRRLEEQRRRKKEDLTKKIEESWHQRQQRQQMLLQQEADIEARIKEKRMLLIKDRERTLEQQRKKQEKNLQRIKQELFPNKKNGNRKKEDSEKHGDREEKRSDNSEDEDEAYKSDVS